MSVTWFGTQHARNDPARDKLDSIVTSLEQLKSEVQSIPLTIWYSLTKSGVSEKERQLYIDAIDEFRNKLTPHEKVDKKHADSKTYSKDYAATLTPFLIKLRTNLPNLKSWKIQVLKELLPAPVQKAAGSSAPTLAGAHAVGSEVTYFANLANTLRGLSSFFF